MLYRLVRSLHGSDGQEHSVITLTNTCSFDFLQIGVPVDLVDFKKTVNPLSALTALRTMIRKQRPDVIQAWMYHGNLASTLSSPASVPVAWGIHHSLHDLENETLATRFLIKSGAFLSKRKNTRKIVYVSGMSQTHHCARGYSLEKSIVIPNGFDCADFSPDDDSRHSIRRELGFNEEQVLIGNFGRYHPVKDHDRLMRAFASVADEFHEAHLLLAGIGIDQTNQDLMGLAYALGIAERVVFLGPRTDMPKLYNALDLYALSSKSESFPNVLGEASACGIPSITTDVGDAELIVGNTGWVVPPADVEALSGALREALYLESQERRLLGARARKHISDRFGLHVVADSYARLYDELYLSTKKSPHP